MINLVRFRFSLSLFLVFLILIGLREILSNVTNQWLLIMPKPSVERRRKMLYLQQFQQIRSNETKNHRSSHSAVDPNFFICSNEYVHKLQDHSRPVTRAATPYVTRERPQTVVVVTRAPSISTSSTPTNSDLSVLNIVSRDGVSSVTNGTYFDSFLSVLRSSERIRFWLSINIFLFR